MVAAEAASKIAKLTMVGGARYDIYTPRLTYRPESSYPRPLWVECRRVRRLAHVTIRRHFALTRGRQECSSREFDPA